MSTRPIVSSVLGPRSQRAADAEVAGLAATLARLDPDEWRATTPTGSGVADVVAHVAEGAQRLADACRRRIDAEPDEVLLHTFDDPAGPPPVVMDTSDPTAVLAAYRDATSQLQWALADVLPDDWEWPVWSPLGGAETLAEAARRWVAHHHVHRADVHVATARPLAEDDEVTRLTAEFSLEAMARRGGDVVTAPFGIEVVTAPPGAGTWTLVFDEPRPRTPPGTVWEALLGHHPAALELHRLEHGGTESARLRVRSDGSTLWRATFRRGASWADLEIHGDDEARRVWQQLLTSLSGDRRSGLAPLQH